MRYFQSNIVPTASSAANAKPMLTEGTCQTNEGADHAIHQWPLLALSGHA
jgi:hypothetical protein